MRELLKKHALFLLFLPLLTVLVYGNSLNNSWHFDDIPTILENENIRSLSNVGRFFTDPRAFSSHPDTAGVIYRPLLLLGYAFTYKVAQYDLPTWHAIQMCLHCFCALIVFFLALQLTQCRNSALFAASLFIVHPIQSQGVNYLSSRSELQVSLFFLLSFFCWLQYRTQEKHKGLWFLSLLFALFALLTKSIAVVIPFAFLLWELWLGPDRDSLRKCLLRILPFVVLVIFFLLLRKLLIGAVLFPKSARGFDILRLTEDASGQGAAQFLGGRSILTNLKQQGVAICRYFSLLLYPKGLSIVHYISAEVSALPALFILVLVGLSLALRKRAPLHSFALLFFFGLLAPTTLIPLNLVMNEHRIYLAVSTLFIAFAHLVCSQKRVKPIIPALLIIILCSFLTRARNKDWRTSLTLFEKAVKVAPKARYVNYEYGYALLKEGFVEDGLTAMEEEARLFTHHKAPFWAAIANLHVKQGNLKKAQYFINEAFRRDKECPEAKKAQSHLERRRLLERKRREER